MVKINPQYITKETIAAAHKHFISQEPKNIQLQSFLSDTKPPRFNWKQVYEPEKRKYSESQYTLPAELITFISQITGKQLKQIQCAAYSFGPGDYILLEDEAQPSGIIIQLEFTPTWDDSWGGYTSFVAENGEVIRTNPQPNALVIVEQTTNLKHFTKYVNHRAGNHKRILIQALLK